MNVKTFDSYRKLSNVMSCNHGVDSQMMGIWRWMEIFLFASGNVINYATIFSAYMQFGIMETVLKFFTLKSIPGLNFPNEIDLSYTISFRLHFVLYKKLL